VSVDIVITNHNYARFLPAAIQSCLGQSRRPGRIIVVDDGSTDASIEVLDRYAGIVTTVVKENGGQASAFNAGFDHVRSETVIFLDADDILAPHAVEAVEDGFARHAGAVRVQYPLLVVDKDGTPTGERKPGGHLRPADGDLRKAELAFPLDLTWVATSGNAFATDALQMLFPVPEKEFRECADWYVVHGSGLLGDVVTLPKPAAYYRVHGSNAYEQAASNLDLAHVRASIRYGAATHDALGAIARTHGLPAPREILSVSDVANRLVSFRLDAARHPNRSDTRRALFGEGLRATRRRFDVSWPMKLLFATWFGMVTFAPRTAVLPLAEIFMYPDKRLRLNGLLARCKRNPSAVFGKVSG
jgi:glycosyltransferase involved in cell wall biosynthesis